MKQQFIIVLFFAAILLGCNTATQNRHHATQPLPDNVSLAGEHNAIIKIEPTAQYLLLPVQESASEDNVRVIVGNTEIDNFVIRLAKDSIDYYVPYILEQGAECCKQVPQALLKFDVRFGDKKISPAEAICWNAIKQSDEFDTTNREQLWRPEYHHTPLYGWMNDPNGMYYDEQTCLWHLYYQYNPYGSMWQNMSWGHSTSSDLLHWQAQPVAIRPDALGAIFSGSCVVDKDNTAGYGKNAVVALYTSARDAQSQSMAYSTDGGITFTSYENNPVLTDSIPDFRDPKVFRNEQANCWTMILACGQEVRFYNSQNLKDWTYASSFGKGYGCHDGVWECPDLLQLGDKWVLLLNINPGGPFGGSATQYFIGDFDGTTFTCVDEPREQKWLDYGKDHYATVTFHNAPDNRVVALAWVSNWQYANQLPTKQYRSQNSLPRDLSLFVDDKGEYRVAVRPAKEVEALKGAQANELTATSVVELDIPRNKRNAVITLSNEKGEKVMMTYNFSKNTFSMDRRKSGLTAFSKDFAAVTTTPLFVNQDTYRLTLFIDHCIIEAFDGDGHFAMTNLTFPQQPYNKLTVQGGEGRIYEINNNH